MSVAAAAARKHDALRDLLGRFERIVRWGIAADVDPVLTQLQRDLARHWQGEEGVVYPTLARVVGGGVGPVACMIEEHDGLRARFEALLALASRGIADPVVRDEMRRAGRTWITDLRAHFDKEEKLVFPLADRLLSVEERVTLAAVFGSRGPFPSLSEFTGDRTEETWGSRPEAGVGPLEGHGVGPSAGHRAGPREGRGVKGTPPR